jgi:hypothetical protein
MFKYRISVISLKRFYYLDYSKINRELERLDKEEEELEVKL